MTTTRDYLESIQIQLVTLLAMDDDSIEEAGITDVVIGIDETMRTIRDLAEHGLRCEHCNEPLLSKHTPCCKTQWTEEHDEWMARR